MRSYSDSIKTLLPLFAVSIVNFAEASQAQLSIDLSASDSTPQNTKNLNISELRNEIVADIPKINRKETDYSPFALEHGYDPESIAESCRYFEGFLEKDRMEQAKIEALCGDQKQKVFDWKTKFWNGSRWLLGTSRNFASITVVGLAIFANVFPKQAVALATTAGAIEGVAALLYKMHEYCKNRKLEQIGYNLLVMNGQAAIRQNLAKAREKVAHKEIEEIEGGQSSTSDTSDNQNDTLSLPTDLSASSSSSTEES